MTSLIKDSMTVPSVTSESRKQVLIQSIKEWIIKHPNPYDHDINEKVYWNMTNILSILSVCEDNIIIISSCEDIYNRFKFYY